MKLLRTSVCTIGLFAGATAMASLSEDGGHIDAANVSWDAQPNLPDELRSVVRWKRLVGGDDIPQTEQHEAARFLDAR